MEKLKKSLLMSSFLLVGLVSSFSFAGPISEMPGTEDPLGQQGNQLGHIPVNMSCLPEGIAMEERVSPGRRSAGPVIRPASQEENETGAADAR